MLVGQLHLLPMRMLGLIEWRSLHQLFDARFCARRSLLAAILYSELPDMSVGMWCLPYSVRDTGIRVLCGCKMWAVGEN